MSKQNKKRLGEILIDLKLITPLQLQAALKKQAQSGNKRVGEILIETKVINSKQLIGALARQFNYPVVDLTKIQPDKQLLDQIPQALCEEYNVIPLRKEGGSIIVCVCDPLDFVAIDNIKFALNMDIKCVLAPLEDIKDHIKKFYTGAGKGKLSDSILEAMADKEVVVRAGEQVDLNTVSEGDDAPIIKFVQQMINSAVEERASDIHVEPMEENVRIRFRIDGVCQTVNTAPKRLQGSLISRIKIMSEMDIAEKRKPQDGRIRVKVQGNDLDIRVSGIPSVHGESIVMRLLNRSSGLKTLEDVGFHPDDYKKFKRIIKKPNGIILVTGPTGSGKTTTLYAILSELNRPDIKIITAENPVEYNITGLNQAQVKENIGLSFARILRAMLRQAPNIILVGEIRDNETSEIAIQAALTGHLVFSTLHTNDAPGALTRLLDMGVKPFLVASSVQAVVAQRLVRMLCPNCKKRSTNPSPSLLRALNITPEQVSSGTICEPEGCPKCNNTGYKGRKGIFELMEIDSEMREMVFRQETHSKIRSHAHLRGMLSLMEDGVRKVLAGLTSLNEILSVTRRDDILY